MLQIYQDEKGKTWKTSTRLDFEEWLKRRRVDRAGTMSQATKDDMYYYGSNYYSYNPLNEMDYAYEKDYVEADFDKISQITVETLGGKETTTPPRRAKPTQYSYLFAATLIVFGVVHIQLYANTPSRENLARTSIKVWNIYDRVCADEFCILTEDYQVERRIFDDQLKF